MSINKFEDHPLNPGEAIPLFISAGVIKEPTQIETFLQLEDPLIAPLITIGGFTYSSWEGNAKPGEVDFVYDSVQGIAGNARGLPNPGKEGILILKPIIKQLNTMGIKTIVQVTNLPFESPLVVIPELVEIAASINPTAVEVNLSCPNGKKEDGSFHPPLSSNADASGEVIQTSRDRVSDFVTLGVKDSPHVSSLSDRVNSEEVNELSRSLRGIVDFVVGINTIGNQVFPEIICANGRGGMSGPIVKEIAKQHARLWNKFAPDIAYLSTGGVDSDNADKEIPERLAYNNVIRVGGAQQFYRSSKPLTVIEQWVQAIV